MTPGGAAVFLNTMQGLTHSRVYIKYFAVLTRCRANCLLGKPEPPDKMHSSQQVTFHISKASSPRQHPWEPGVRLSFQETRYDHTSETIQIPSRNRPSLGFCQRDQNLSPQFANTKDVCFHLLYQEDRCSLLFPEHLWRPFICLDFNRNCRDGPLVLKHWVLLVSEQIKVMCSCCEALMGIPRFQSRSQAGSHLMRKDQLKGFISMPRKGYLIVSFLELYLCRCGWTIN